MLTAQHIDDAMWTLLARERAISWCPRQVTTAGIERARSGAGLSLIEAWADRI
jgi:hypothetical protein